MKLFKKMMIALSVLCFVGMLAACSNGNSNNNGGGSGGGWVIMYDGEVYLDGLTYDDIQEGIEGMNLETPADYTINQSPKTLTLTAAGYAKVEAFEEAMEAEEYSIVDNGTEIVKLPAYVVASMGELLEEGTDYTINESTKTVTLTESGYTKGGELLAQF